MWSLSATKTGGDLAAYFRPANATMWPPKEFGLKEVVLMVRRDISSTLGLNIARREPDRDKRVSQGES